MTTPVGTVRLRRGPGVRLFAGYWFQGLLTAAVVLTVALGVLVTVLVGSFDAAGFLGLLPLLLVWGAGVFAGAWVDDDGLRWRWFAGHRRPWSQVQQIRFGSAFVGQATVGASSPGIFVTSDGHEHPVRPTYGCSERRRLEFADAIVVHASAHGVPCTVTNAGWEGLRAGLPVTRGDVETPGVRRSPQNTRIRVGLFGLALLVLGVLGIVGAITGWDTSGTSPVALAITGGVLLLIGALILALMAATSGA